MVKLDNMLSRLWVDFITENDKMHLEEKDNLDVFDSYVKNIYANEEYDLEYLVNFVIDNYVFDIQAPEIKDYERNTLILFLQKLSKNIDCKTKVDIINSSPFEIDIKTFLYYFVLIYEEVFLNISNMTLINQLSDLFNIVKEGRNKEELNELIIKELSKIGIKDYSNIIVKFLLQNKRKIFEDGKTIETSNILISGNIESMDTQDANREEIRHVESSPLETVAVDITSSKQTEPETIDNIIVEEKSENLYMTVKLKDKFNKGYLNTSFYIYLKDKEKLLVIKNKVKQYFNGNYNTRILGVPSTGKSYYLNESLLKYTKISIDNISKISIEKGINGTTSNRLILGYGYKNGIPIDKEGIILKTIKKAIQNPYDTFVIILEDSHNQNMNDLLSPIISIMKNTDRFDISAILDKYQNLIKEDWVINLNRIYGIDINLMFKNYKQFIGFIKDFIIEFNDRNEENLLSFPVSVILPNIINDNIEEEYFLPNNLYINMTSNYNNNSILEMEWEDRINTVILEPITLRSKLKKFLLEDKTPSIIDFYLKVNELLENELYKYEYLEADKLLVGHYTLINENLQIVDTNDTYLINKIMSYINNSMEYYDIYNKREIFIHIIMELLNIDIFENYINKKLGSNNIFKVLSNVSDIHSLEDNDKVKLSKSIKKLLK
jgi:hypothetical protein